METATQPYVNRKDRGPDVKVKLSITDITVAATAIQDALFEAVGEITPEIEQALDDLLSLGSESLDAGAWVVRKLTGEAETCKAEAGRYKARADALERNCEALKGRMLLAVDTAFSGKLKTERNTIYGQTAGDVTKIELAPEADETSLDRIWQTDSALVRRSLELNKTEIKHRFEAGEPLPPTIAVEVVPGKRSLRIR
jgi:hypothetical protein